MSLLLAHNLLKELAGKEVLVSLERLSISYQSATSFSEALKERVKSYFVQTGQSRLATRSHCFKSAALMALTLLNFYALVSYRASMGVTLTLCVLLSLLVSAVGFNVMHEAAHGNFSSNPKWNRLLALSMDLMGISSAFYKIKHTVFHHNFTNIYGADGDISETPLIRMSPAQPRWWIHRYQKYYSMPLYSLITLSWFFNDFQRFANARIGQYSFKRPPTREIQLMFVMKLAHFLFWLGIPSLFLPFLSVLACYLFCQLVLGLLVAIVFQVAHLFEGVDFPKPVNSKVENDWMIHQIATTTDFSTHHWFWDAYLGGLNYQVEHHLFPNVSCAHYPEIQKIVKATCLEFGIQYHEISSFSEAIKTHFSLLDHLGNP